MNKIIQPADDLIERTALEFAAIYYEAGRSTGLTSKYKNAKKFAAANFEKFIPKVVDHFLDILNNPSFDADAKLMIWEALQKRHNDPRLQTGKELPDIDVKKLIALTRKNQGNDATQSNLKLIEDVAKQQSLTDDPILKKLGLH